MSIYNHKRIGLALSGGGIRAAIYHLGVLKYLAEVGLFDNITSISSVSGASLCVGAIFAVNNNKWTDGERFLSETLPSVCELIQSTDIQKSALLRLPFTPKYWFHRVAMLAQMLEKKWGITGSIQDLPQFPNAPYWEINCTTFETGHRWRFRRDYMGDYLVGKFPTPDLPISHVIAASAGFPILIGPYTLQVEGAKYTLWDGEVFDNLGMEALYKIERGLDSEIDYLIVSDASAVMGKAQHKRGASVANVKRLLDISMHQVYALRSREFHTSIVENGKGAHLQISGAARNYPTTLSTPCKGDFDMILHNGYEVAKSNFEAFASV